MKIRRYKIGRKILEICLFVTIFATITPTSQVSILGFENYEYKLATAPVLEANVRSMEAFTHFFEKSCLTEKLAEKTLSVLDISEIISNSQSDYISKLREGGSSVINLSITKVSFATYQEEMLENLLKGAEKVSSFPLPTGFPVPSQKAQVKEKNCECTIL